MLKLGRVTKVKGLFLVLVFVLILACSNVFEFSAAILEKGLLDYSLSIYTRDSLLGLRPRQLSRDRNLELII